LEDINHLANPAVIKAKMLNSSRPSVEWPNSKALRQLKLLLRHRDPIAVLWIAYAVDFMPEEKKLSAHAK